MANGIFIENLEAGELLTRLEKLEGAITALCTQPQPTATDTVTDYITRREVAQLFGISLVTVHDWTNKGILTAYKIGNKVFYKRVEVENALVRKGGRYVQ
ncbi:MAG: helix-turn-helix domain-containing protein [Prevotellaceae bacterium]|jgi:excisionase family DNA binding protein|nr:helix-turn-helix domain-containing protein [Prevotellaceae bacterium]